MKKIILLSLALGFVFMSWVTVAQATTTASIKDWGSYYLVTIAASDTMASATGELTNVITLPSDAWNFGDVDGTTGGVTSLTGFMINAATAAADSVNVYIYGTVAGQETSYIQYAATQALLHLGVGASAYVSPKILVYSPQFFFKLVNKHASAAKTPKAYIAFPKMRK